MEFFSKYEFVYLFIHKLDHLLFFPSARVKVRDYRKTEIHYIYIYKGSSFPHDVWMSV